MKKPAIFAAVILIALLFMNLLDFSIFGYTKDEGWYVTDSSITTFMENGEVRTVELTYVDAMEPIYERLGSLFVTEEKLAVDTSYPMFVGEDASRVYFSDDSMALVTNNFGSLSTYAGLYLSAGVTYNTDGTRADGDEFILTYMPNGLYLAAQNIVVNTVYAETMIPMNSVVDFSADSILYMAFSDGEMQGDEVLAMNQATITIGSKTYNYYQFLLQLGILQEKIVSEGTLDIDDDDEEALETFLNEKEKLTIEDDGTSADTATASGAGNLWDGEGESWDGEDAWKYTSEDSEDNWYPEDEWVYSSDLQELEDEEEDELDDWSDEEAYDEDLYATEEPEDASTEEGSESGDDSSFNFGSDGTDLSDDGSSDFNWSSGGSSSGTGDGEPSDPVYTMPTVTIGDTFVPWVYTITGEATIVDEDNRLATVTVYVYSIKDDVEKLEMRKVVSSTGEFVLSVLEPETDYTFDVCYTYYNNSNTKVESWIYINDTCTTLKMDGNLVAFTPILSDDEIAGEIYPEKFTIHELQYVEAVQAAELSDVLAAETAAIAAEAAADAAETAADAAELAAEEARTAATEAREAVATAEDREAAEEAAEAAEAAADAAETAADAAELAAEEARTAADEARAYYEELAAVYPNYEFEEINGKTAVDTIAFVGRGTITIQKVTLNEDGGVASKVGNESTASLSSSNLSTMSNGGVTAFTTSATYDTNSNYQYDIVYYDTFGNVMPLTDASVAEDDGGSITEGLGRTSKFVPTVTLATAQTTVADVILNIKINNPDEADMSGVIFRILDGDGNQIDITGSMGDGAITSSNYWTIGDGYGETLTTTATITNLETSKLYYAQVYCDEYDVLDLVTHEEEILASISFYTRSIATLGYAEFETIFSDYSSSGVTATSRMKVTTDSTLKQLLTRGEIEITQGDESIAIASFSKEELSQISIMDSVGVDVGYSGDLEENQTALVYDADAQLWKLEVPVTMTVGDEIHTITLYLTGLTANAFNSYDTVWDAYLASSSTDATSPALVSVISGLDSNTQYGYSVNAYAQQGSATEYDVSGLVKTSNFTTWKLTPEVTIKNQFTGDNFHEMFDYRVYDKDGAITNGTSDGVTVALYKNGTLVQSHSISASNLVDFDEADAAGYVYGYRFANLEANTEYEIRFIAKEYNDGSGQQTSYRLATYTFITGTGISGDLTLDSIDKLYAVNDGTTEDGKIAWEDWNLLSYAAENCEYVYGGYVMSSTGNTWTTSTTTFAGYKEIPVSEGQQYVFTGGDGTDIYYTFYDEDGNACANRANADSYGFIITAPDDAVCMSFVLAASSYFWSAGGSLLPYDSTLSAKNDNIFTIDGRTENYTLSITASVSTSTSTGIYVTDYIPIETGSVYELTGRSDLSSTTMYVCYYNQYKKFIKGQYIRGDELLVAPESATYIRMDSYEPYDDTTSVRKYATLDPQYLSGKVDVTVTDLLNELPEYMENPEYQVRISWAELEYADYDEFYTELTDEKEDDEYWQKSGDIPVVEGSDPAWRQALDQLQYKELTKNYAWKVELYLEIFESEVTLDELKFTTEGSIKTISNEEELLAIKGDPSGNYVVINDFTTESRAYTSGGFSGTLDLQGYTITYENTNFYSLFSTLESNGTIKNGVFDVNIDVGSTYNSSSLTTLVGNNYGTIENVVVNIETDYKDYPFAANYCGGMVYTNYATGNIKNFVVYYENEMLFNYGFGGVARQNYGTIQNGWVGGAEDAYIRMVNYSYEDGNDYLTLNYDTGSYYAGMITQENLTGGVIRNVYTLLDMYEDGPTVSTSYNGALTVDYNVGTVENTYAVGDVYQYNPNSDYLYEINLRQETSNLIERKYGSNNISNIWQVERAGTISARDSYEKVASAEIVYDILWQDSVINADDQFYPSESISLGIYPQVELGADMANNQPEVKLPEANATGLDIISTLVEYQSYDSANVIITVENPNKYTITDFEIDGIGTVVITDQNITEEKYRVYATLSNPSKYVSAYEITSMSYTTSNGASDGTNYGDLTQYGTKWVYAEFYRPIGSVSEWTEYVVGSPSENAYLTNDIDFSEVTNGYDNRVVVTGAFSGKLDGGVYNSSGVLIDMYELQNIDNFSTSYGSVFHQLNGSIKNVVIDNYTAGDMKSLDNVGFVRYMVTGSRMENVHIQNSELSGCANVGGLAAYSYYSYIYNCSSSNVTIKYYRDTGAQFFIAGGILGASYGTTVDTCYVQDFLVDEEYIENVGGVGGIVGKSFYYEDSILNCWSSGTINVLARNLGGIVGRQENSGQRVNHCWSIVDISTVGDGIGGLSGTGYGAITNSIALGDLVSRSTSVTTLNRLGQGTITNGYAYAYQLLNGEVSTDLNGAINLMTMDDLALVNSWENQMVLGDSFDYAGGSEIFGSVKYSVSVEDNYLPMLLYKDGRALYGQEPIQLQELDLDISVQETSLNQSTNYFTVLFDVVADYELPEGTTYTVTMAGIDEEEEFEYIDVSISGYNNMRRISVSGYLYNAWDSYMITVTVNSVNGTGTHSEKIIFNNGPVYATISTADEWNSYLYGGRESTFENIRITGDLNFSSTKILATSVSLNRLEGYNVADATAMYNFGGIDGGTESQAMIYTAGESEPRFSLIQTVVSYMKNINFTNITMDTSNTGDSDNTGLIGSVYGSMQNIEFNDINLHFSDGDMVGTIGYLSAVVSDVTMEGINIVSDGGSYVGGLAGYLDCTTAQLTNITMNGTKTYNGSGDEDDPENYTYTNNVISNDSSNSTKSYFGGLYGYHGQQSNSWTRDFTNIYISGVKVEGKSRVGGMGGMTTHYMYFRNVTIKDSYVHAERTGSYGGTYAGGLDGYYGYMYIYDCLVSNVDVVADYERAGGISGDGHTNFTPYDSIVENSRISAGIYLAGGIAPLDSCADRCIVRNCVIESGTDGDSYGTSSYYGKYAGGIIGYNAYSIRDCVVQDTTVIGREYVGGISGYLNRDGYTFTSNTVINSTIIGEEQVGGLYGEAISKVDRGTVMGTTITGDVNVGGAIGRSYSPDVFGVGVDDETKVNGGVNVGGLVGYIPYYTTVSTDRITYLDASYSAATVDGDDYVGGLIGHYVVGAETGSSWPQQQESDYGTQTTVFPVSYTGLMFMGDVTSDGTYVSLWGNKYEHASEYGMQSTRIYEGATINRDSPASVVGSTTDLQLVTTATTASGLSIATTQQINTPEFYQDPVSEGGMAWNVGSKTGQYMGNTMSPLYGEDVQIYRDGDDIILYTSESELSGTKSVTFTNGGADLENEYVTEDLVLWLDAKNNSGFGVYDDTALTWVNLAETTGADWNGTLKYSTYDPLSYLEWRESGLYNKNSNTYGYVHVPSLYDQLTDPTNYTVQFVYDTTQTGNVYVPMMAELTDTTEAFAAARGTYSRVFFVGGDSAMGTPYTPDNEYMLTYSTEKISGTQYKYAYSNGASYPTDTASSSSWDGEFMEYDLQVGNGDWRSSGLTIAAVRVYDGILSADELAQNAVADAGLYGNGAGLYNSDFTMDVAFTNGVARITAEAYEAAYKEAYPEATEVDTLEAYVNVSVALDSGSLSSSVFVNSTSPTLTLKDENGTELYTLQRFTETPQVAVTGGNSDYTWYRTTEPVAVGGQVAEEFTDNDLRYLDGRGYYYCMDSDGNYSPLILVDTANYMYYPRRYYTSIVGASYGAEGLNTRNDALENEEITPENGVAYANYDYDLYDTSDGWYSGGFALPLPEIVYGSEATATASMLMRSFEMIVSEPPEAEIYPVSATELNIEFDDSIPYNDEFYMGDTYFQIYADDVLLAESYIDNRVYTLQYDYVTDLTVVIGNGDESMDLVYEVSAKDMQQDVMTYGNDYYYISPDGVSYSTGSFSAQFVHLMDGLGVTTTGGVYDVTKGTLVDKISGIAIQEEVTPAFSGEYQGINVDSFAGFCDFDGVLQEGMGFVVKDGVGYSIPGDGSVSHNGFVADTYGSTLYLGLLTEDGDFGDVTGNINIPEEFTTYNIDHMTNTIDSKTHYVLVRYESNKVAGFDYVTGELLDLTQPDDINYGVVEFFNDFVASITTTTSMIFASDYVEAVELQAAIENDDSMAQILNDGTIYTGDDFDDESVSGLGDEEIITEDTEADGEVAGVTDVVGEANVSSDEEVDGAGDGDGDIETDIDGDLVDGDGDGDGSGVTTTSTSSGSDDAIDTDQESKEDSGSQTSKDEMLTEDVEDVENSETEASESTAKVGTTVAERQASAESAQRYIVAYNAESGAYELYLTSDLTEGMQSVVSETEKVVTLQANGELPEFNKGTVAQGSQNRDTGLSMFTVVVVSIGGLVFVLLFVFTSKRRRRRKKTFASRIGKDE